MKLHTFFRSSASFRVRIALNLKNQTYQSIATLLNKGAQHSAEFLAVNPQGLIPALELADGTVLSQSLAIIEYLDEQYPTPPLLPPDALGRAQVRSMALAIACDVHPLNNLRVLNYLKKQLQQDETSVNTWYRHWITIGFGGLEQLVRRHSSDGRHCYGNSMSLADVMLVPQIFNARRFETDLSPFPTLVGISTHLEAHPAFAAARPEAQPDAF